MLVEPIGRLRTVPPFADFRKLIESDMGDYRPLTCDIVQVHSWATLL